MRKFLAVLFSVIVFLVSPSVIFAHDGVNHDAPSGEIPQFNSFEAFWPMVAGKTKVDSLYFLKRFKEKTRGAIIFGLPQKADYSLLLANKRLLEAEKLINDDKGNAAAETIDSAQAELKKASEKITDIKEKKILNQVDPASFARVEEMKKFVEYLLAKTQDNVSEKLNTASSTLKEISSALTN